MELDLNELAATLTIGSFFIFGIEFLLLNFFGSTITGKFFRSFDPATKKYVMGAVLITLSFIFGMVLEDVSNKFVDDDKWTWYLPIIRSDDTIKRDVFVRHNTIDNYDHSPLLRDALAGNLIERPHRPESKQFADYVRSLPSCRNGLDAQGLPCTTTLAVPSKEAVVSVAKAFYFEAKSEVYRIPNYYDELKKIQLRIDFARALVVVSSTLLLLTIAGWLIRLILVRRFLKKSDLRIQHFRQLLPAGWKSTTAQIKVFRIRCEKEFERRRSVKPYFRVYRLVLSVMILAGIYSLAAFAYNSEEEEFDKRVFGYYISLKSQPAQSKQMQQP